MLLYYGGVIQGDQMLEIRNSQGQSRDSGPLIQEEYFSSLSQICSWAGAV